PRLPGRSAPITSRSTFPATAWLFIASGSWKPERLTPQLQVQIDLPARPHPDHLRVLLAVRSDQPDRVSSRGQIELRGKSVEIVAGPAVPPVHVHPGLLGGALVVDGAFRSSGEVDGLGVTLNNRRPQKIHPCTEE